MSQHAKIKHNDGRNKRPQQHQELALREQIGLAGFVNQLRNFAHGAMYRQVLQPHVNQHAKAQTEDAEQQPYHQQPMPVDPEERNRRKVGQFQSRLATLRRLGQRAAGSEKQQSGKRCRNFRKPACYGRKVGVPSTHQNPPKKSFGVTACCSPSLERASTVQA
jgi:hypothetical protein